jgi:hypothetical protein
MTVQRKKCSLPNPAATIMNAAAAKYSVIQIHRRSLPNSSTSGLHSGLSIQGSPSQLV